MVSLIIESKLELEFDLFSKQIYIYIYISRSVAFIVVTLQLSHISIHVIIFFLSNFPIIVFNFFLIFTLFQPFYLPYFFISPLLLQPFSLPYLFISSLPSTLISFFLFLFIFHYFCLLIHTLYYKFVTIYFILCTVFPHNKKILSLSHTHTKFFVVFFFIFLASML